MGDMAASADGPFGRYMALRSLTPAADDCLVALPRHKGLLRTLFYGFGIPLHSPKAKGLLTHARRPSLRVLGYSTCQT